MIDNATQITTPYGDILKITSSLGTLWQKTLNVSIIAGEGGNVAGIPDIWKYEDVVSLSAIPNEGYIFDQWSDGELNAVRSITVLEDISLTANFIHIFAEKNQPSLVVDMNRH